MEQEWPKALAMIICDEIIEDKRTNKKSLIGIFNSIAAYNLPIRHKKMLVFISVTNCRGSYKTILQYSSLKDLKPIAQIHGTITSTDPNAVIECAFELFDVAFPYEGKYNFQLLIDDRPVTERVFNLVKGTVL
ncbi:MAG: hypothetical protein HYS07_10535 [Chlamydiae bacterium]|nr:hypothetical protein [Chlamydiota bacterium]